MTAAIDLHRAPSARERDLAALPARKLEGELRSAWQLAWGHLALRGLCTTALVAGHEGQPNARALAVAAVLAVESEVRR